LHDRRADEVLSKIAKEFEIPAAVFSMNVDDPINREWAKSIPIFNIPAFVLLRHGQIQSTLIGLAIDRLREAIERNVGD